MSKKDSTNKKTTQKIKCDVNNCNYNNNENNMCNLDEIKVSCSSSSENTTEKKETICDSFQCDCDCHETETE